MTMPFERTRAVLQTREFLRWVLSAEATSEMLMQAKREARALLRHYPSTSDMEIAHHACPMWFGAARERSGPTSADDAYRPIGEADFTGHEFEVGPTRSVGPSPAIQKTVVTDGTLNVPKAAHPEPKSGSSE